MMFFLAGVSRQDCGISLIRSVDIRRAALASIHGGDHGGHDYSGFPKGKHVKRVIAFSRISTGKICSANTRSWSWSGQRACSFVVFVAAYLPTFVRSLHFFPRRYIFLFPIITDADFSASLISLS